MEQITVPNSQEKPVEVQEATTSHNDEISRPMNTQPSVELTACSFNNNMPTCSSMPIPTCSTAHPQTTTTSYVRNIEMLDLKTISVPLILLRHSSIPAAVLPPDTLHPENEVSSSTNNTQTPTTYKTPASLFQQALAGLNQSSISQTILNTLKNHSSAQGLVKDPSAIQQPEVSTPNSLTSAPPSYSFVLRQINAQRRPRLMGTFIPSPSFVQHAPPPNYAAAFDIYIDSPPSIPMVQQRTCQFTYTPMNIICSECGFGGTTVIKCKVTIWTHLCAIVLCLMCCWICAPLPYLLNSCKNVFHYCRSCRAFLGMYSPSNPDNPHLR